MRRYERKLAVENLRTEILALDRPPDGSCTVAAGEKRGLRKARLDQVEDTAVEIGAEKGALRGVRGVRVKYFPLRGVELTRPGRVG